MVDDTSRFDDTELLARLVAFPSVSRRPNGAIVDFVANYLDRPGVRIERDVSADGERSNLLVWLGGDPDAATEGEAGPNDRPGLTLSGHLDVVPADEPDWQSDPFELRDAGDRFVARGACDMKGFVALAIQAMARRAAAGSDAPSWPVRPLALVLTYDEEIGIVGARELVERAPGLERLPRRTIVGEPTSLRPIRLHKGHGRLRLVIEGTPAHSGFPHLGHNAVEPLGRAIVALSALRRQLETERHDTSSHFADVPFVALNLARIEAGAAVNVVPERAALELGFRLLPGVDGDAIVERMRSALAQVLDGERWRLEGFDLSPPMCLDPSSDLWRRLSGASATATGPSADPSSADPSSAGPSSADQGAAYATDAGWLQRAGFDCVIWGPGDIGVAHKPNEWLPKAEWRRAAVELDSLIDHYCIDAPSSTNRSL